MANKYGSLKELFTAIADAIRAKTGGTDEIVADDFPEAIEGITSNDTANEDAIVSGNVVSYFNDRVTKVKDYLFCITGGNRKLTHADFPSCTGNIGYCAFRECYMLESVNFPKAWGVGGECFRQCDKLNKFIAPEVMKIGPAAFDRCDALSIVDIARNTKGYVFDCGIDCDAFSGCDMLLSLVIGNPTFVMPLYNPFVNTPIANGMGYIYVPSAIIEQYKADEVWSTYASQFRVLEDYTVDGTITGALDETKI